jgi:hypothetical protein
MLNMKQHNRMSKLYPIQIALFAPKPIGQLEQLGEDLLNLTGSKDLAGWLRRFAGS